MTPKALSAEELRHAITMGSIPALVAHIAALEADNAAIARHLETILKSGTTVSLEAAEARTALAQSHPGAALLERHEKAMEAWARLVGIAEKQGRSVGGVLDDAEGHRKALVRARNEGLEKAAKALLAKRDALRPVSDRAGGRRDGLEEAASIVRALIEPEQ